MNAPILVLNAETRLLPLLEPSKANAMKRVAAACDAQRIARQIDYWGAPQACTTTEECVWYYLSESVMGGNVTERHLATLEFIFDRVPGGRDADVRSLSEVSRREIFWSISKEAATHVEHYRADFRLALS